MPSIPSTEISQGTNVQSRTSAEILNAVRSESSELYQANIPCAVDGDVSSLRTIGNIMMRYQPLQNEFLTNLVNRIGRVIITSKMYRNPWSGFKKGMLEFGETVEEIFVALAKPHQYNPCDSERHIFKKYAPDVYAAFHTMNYQKWYPSTINNDQLRQAFLSWNGITDLIAKIVDAMYSAAEYDEFIVMKYLIARMITQGNLYSEQIPAVTAANAKSIVSIIKGNSNMLEFMSTKYNMVGVQTYTNKRDQFIIMNAAFDAVIDVEVLASAFNLDKAEFMGNRVLVDDFANLDTERLNEIFKDDPNYVPITEEQLNLMKTIPAVILDRDWFMIFDNQYHFTEVYDPVALSWNYFYHVWKTFSASPFANAIAFTTTASTVTGLTVTPQTATVGKCKELQLTAEVATTGVASKAVFWTVTGGTDTTVDATGKVRVGANETAASVVVNASSVFDPTKSATSTITIA